jgi:FHIPEP family
VGPLQRLGEWDRSRQALQAYGDAIGPSPDATTLWDLADGYKKLEDWNAARETFQRALQADQGVAAGHGRLPFRHADLYRWEIARARWGEGSYREAFDELELVTGDAPQWRSQTPDYDGPTLWTKFVAELLAQKAIPDLEAYRALRTWLERRQRGNLGPDTEPARRDAGGALLRLARARRDGTGGPGWSLRDRLWDARETLPVVSPIMLHGDSALFPGPDTSPMRKLTAAYTKLTAEIEAQIGIRLPLVLIRASDESQHKGRRHVVKLHEIPLWSGIASRNHTEQRIVSEGIGPVVRQYLDTYLGFAEVDELLDRLATVSPSSEAGRIAAGLLSSGARHLRLVQILQRLVRESVPVTELEAILQAFEWAASQGEVDEVVDRMRKALVERLPRTAPGIGLGPAWEARIEGWVQRGDGKRFLAIPVGKAHLRQRLVDLIAAHTRAAPEAVIVVRDDLRRFVRRLVAPQFPFLPVLAQGEWAGSPGELQPLEAAPQPEPERVG